MEFSSTGRRSILKRLGTTALGTALLTGTTQAETEPEPDSPDVSRGEATAIAKRKVKQLGRTEEFRWWDPSGVESPELFHAKVETEDGRIEYVPRAWVFPIETWGRDVGYITIDAGQTDLPVLAYGKYQAPQRRLSRAQTIASAQGTSVQTTAEGETNPNLLYYGGVDYSVETGNETRISLRYGDVKRSDPVESAEALKPTKRRNSAGDVVTISGGSGEPPEWDGPVDDGISGVPNWTASYDEGRASSTQIGWGPDNWDEWDGCVPIAGSMVIGYHEGIEEWASMWKESTIDKLHQYCDTSDAGNTKPWKVAPGIESYSGNRYDYNVNHNRFNVRGNVKDAIANGNPPILAMYRGPYTKDDGVIVGHAVPVVGYEVESNDLWGTSVYYKVHNGDNDQGGYGQGPDRVAGGNWSESHIYRIKPE